jgi:hypothetical protein
MVVTCDVCGATFQKRNTLLRHTRNTHTQQKGNCSTCLRRFSRRDNFNRHKSIMHKDDTSTVFFQSWMPDARCPFCNITLVGLDPENSLDHVSTCPRNSSRVAERVTNRKNWYACGICGRQIYRHSNLAAHMVRAHTVHSDHEVPKNDDDVSEPRKIEELPAPSQQDIKNLAEGHLMLTQLIVTTKVASGGYSPKLGVRGSRSTFVLTRFARRFAAVGLLLEVMACVVHLLMEPHRMEGVKTCIVTLFSTDGSLEYPLSSGEQDINEFPYPQFLDRIGRAQQSNRHMGLTSEMVVDVTSFQLRSGKGVDDDDDDSNSSTLTASKHPRTRVRKHSTNMYEFLRNKYGLLNVERIKTKMLPYANTISYQNACFVLSLAAAIRYPERAALQTFKR